MLVLSVLAAAAFAQAAPSSPAPHTQEMTWQVTYQGKPVGERTVTVKYVPEKLGMRRIIESETSLDGHQAGLPYTFAQRMTATAVGRSPASFHSVVDDNGTPREVQGRLVGGQWMVTLVESGRSKTWEVNGSDIDLSTADLFDPQSFVPLSKFSTVKVLSAETGDIWTQPVGRLGPSEIPIAGKKIPVEGWAVEPPQGKASFWYTTDGVLVRYDYRWMGRIVQAELTAPPPPGVDDAPVAPSGVQAVRETNL